MGGMIRGDFMRPSTISRALLVRMEQAAEKKREPTKSAAPEKTPAEAKPSPSEALGAKAKELWARVETLPDVAKEKIDSFDGERFASDAGSFWKRVLDNTLTGDWFNRGELYFVVQIALLLLILRDPGALDYVVAFFLGPVPLLTGIYVVWKSVVDLGAENLVPWLKPPPTASLKTDGIYGFMRHPIYTGIVLSCLGFSAVTHSPERLLLTATLFFFLKRKSEEEEKFLVQKFGKDYEEYSSKVKAFIPKLY